MIPPPIRKSPDTVWPLRTADGRTFAERRAQQRDLPLADLGPLRPRAEQEKRR